MARPRLDIVQLHEYDGRFEFQVGTTAFRLVSEGAVWALYAQGTSDRILYESFNEAMHYALDWDGGRARTKAEHTKCRV